MCKNVERELSNVEKLTRCLRWNVNIRSRKICQLQTENNLKRENNIKERVKKQTNENINLSKERYIISDVNLSILYNGKRNSFPYKNELKLHITTFVCLFFDSTRISFLYKRYIRLSQTFLYSNRRFSNVLYSNRTKWIIHNSTK